MTLGRVLRLGSAHWDTEAVCPLCPCLGSQAFSLGIPSLPEGPGGVPGLHHWSSWQFSPSLNCLSPMLSVCSEENVWNPLKSWCTFLLSCSYVMGLAGGHFCATASSLLRVSAVLERQCALLCPGQLAAVLCEVLQNRAGPVCVYSLASAQ